MDAATTAATARRAFHRADDLPRSTLPVDEVHGAAAARDGEQRPRRGRECGMEDALRVSASAHAAASGRGCRTLAAPLDVARLREVRERSGVIETCAPEATAVERARALLKIICVEKGPRAGEQNAVALRVKENA